MDKYSTVCETTDRSVSSEKSRKAVDALFRHHKDRLKKVIDSASGIFADMRTLGDFIEGHTSLVCPSCSNVCCINRHSYHSFEDMIFIYAIGEEIPRHSSALADETPCQFLGEEGCIIPRTLRPYRCNWYFCSPLLGHITEHSSSRRYRFFIGLLQNITEGRQKMINEYVSGVLGISVSYTGESG
jgi:hypothetical protein